MKYKICDYANYFVFREIQRICDYAKYFVFHEMQNTYIIKISILIVTITLQHQRRSVSSSTFVLLYCHNISMTCPHVGTSLLSA